MKFSTRGLAKHIGVSPSAVSQARKAGRVAPSADGLFDDEQPLVKIFIAEARANKSNYRGAVGSPQGIAGTLEVFATFPDGEHIIVRHSFDADAAELDPVYFPIPCAVRVDYGADARVFTLDGTELPARTVSNGCASKRVAEVHA